MEFISLSYNDMTDMITTDGMVDALEQYMEKLNADVPPFMKKNLEEIRDLDMKVNTIMKDIKLQTAAHVKNYKKLSRDQKTKAYKEVQSLFKDAEKMSERKVRLAQKMYDLIDEHIKEMDNHNAKFSEHQTRKRNDSDDKKRKSAGGSVAKKRRKADGDASESPGFKALAPPLEMPVDPNEPIYCLCHQVSFGQMVACDNKACKTEWFHFQCVGLTATPKGSWYCDACKEQRKKKK